MPNVDGKEYPYTPAGKRAANAARATQQGAEKPQAAPRSLKAAPKRSRKPKSDMIKNISPTIRNLGY